MADIRRDWLTNQNTDWCFVVIGLVRRQSHSPLLQLKIDPVRQMCPPSLLASSKGQRIFINIRGQYSIQKNIYIHPWYRQWRVQTSCPRRWTAGNQASESLASLHWQQDSWVLWLRDRVNRRWSTPRIYTTRPASPLTSRTTQLWCFSKTELILVLVQ